MILNNFAFTIKFCNGCDVMKYRFVRFPGGKPKAVTFSYDDGIKSDLRLADILDEYNIKCTFNIPNTSIGGTGCLSEDEIRNLHKNGHEIAVHCARHRAPGQIRPIEGIRDVMENRIALENILGCIIRGMAYPNSGITRMESGTSYEVIRNYLKSLDIAYARTLGGDNDSFYIPEDWYAWMPTAHHNNPKIFDYIDKFTAFSPDNMYYSSKGARLFYIWGHSYEFANENNWDRLKKICEKLANRDDIYYATNIEIYDYVNAYYSLMYSADEKMAYNPSFIKIWFECDGKLYCIEPGETIKLN